MRKRIKYGLLAFASIISLAGCSSASKEASTTAATETESIQETTIEKETTVSPATETEEETKGAATIMGIKDVFAEHGIKAGVAVTREMLANPVQSQIILQNFNSLTMENAMKPDYILDKKKSIAAGDIVVNFNNEMVKIMEWAKENNFSMRGHTIVWYSQTPDWIFHEDFDVDKALVSREVMLARLESYIKQIFEQLEAGGFTELFYAYDVVNEAWMENGTLRDNLWLQTIGDDYLWQSFYLADKYAPESIDLYYNDYNEQYKAETLLAFVETLKDENGEYLIDGIGFQAHLYTKDNLNTYLNTVDKLAATGLKLQLTELDVCLGSWQQKEEATDENLKIQGQYYYDLIKGILDRIDNKTLNTDALTVWGFADGLSWRKESSPLLFDRNLAPKPSYYGIMQQEEKIGK